jgi:hypothetical protein
LLDCLIWPAFASSFKYAALCRNNHPFLLFFPSYSSSNLSARAAIALDGLTAGAWPQHVERAARRLDPCNSMATFNNIMLACAGTWCIPLVTKMARLLGKIVDAGRLNYVR